MDSYHEAGAQRAPDSSQCYCLLKLHVEQSNICTSTGTSLNASSIARGQEGPKAPTLSSSATPKCALTRRTSVATAFLICSLQPTCSTHGPQHGHRAKCTCLQLKQIMVSRGRSDQVHTQQQSLSAARTYPRNHQAFLRSPNRHLRRFEL